MVPGLKSLHMVHFQKSNPNKRFERDCPKAGFASFRPSLKLKISHIRERTKMSSYAWEKFHLAAEMLRQDGDKRSKLAEAFAHEIGQLKESDIPQCHRETIDSIIDRLTLPDNVETISRMAHPHNAVKYLTDDEIDEVFQAIFKLEVDLNIYSTQNEM